MEVALRVAGSSNGSRETKPVTSMKVAAAVAVAAEAAAVSAFPRSARPPRGLARTRGPALQGQWQGWI